MDSKKNYKYLMNLILRFVEIVTGIAQIKNAFFFQTLQD